MISYILALHHHDSVSVPNKALAMSMIQFGGVIGKIVMGNLSTLVIKMKLMKVTVYRT